MATMYEKLESYLGFPPDIFKKVILVQSKGVETIEKWYYTEKPKPTQEQLDAIELTYIQKRKREYPAWEDVLHALIDGGDTLADLQAKRTAIKNKYPKE